MALESANITKAEAQKALQEIEALKKIAAGEAFFMQSKNIKLIICYLPESGALQERSSICPVVCLMPLHTTEPKGELDGKSVLVSVC